LVYGANTDAKQQNWPVTTEKAKNCRAAIAAGWKFENFGNAWAKMAVKVGKKSKWSLKYMLRLCLFFQKFEGFMLINLMLIKKKECMLIFGLKMGNTLIFLQA